MITQEFIFLNKEAGLHLINIYLYIILPTHAQRNLLTSFRLPRKRGLEKSIPQTDMIEITLEIFKEFSEPIEFSSKYQP